MYVRTYVGCTYVCMHMCMYALCEIQTEFEGGVTFLVLMWTTDNLQHTYMHVCVYVGCTCVCMHVCMFAV